MDKLERLMLAALAEWPGTPEELGATLEEARQPIPPPTWPGATNEEAVNAERDRIRRARNLMRSTPACEYLLDYELAQ